jgi:hypothetical protein
MASLEIFNSFQSRKRDIKSTDFVFLFHSILRVGQFLGIQLGSNPKLLLRFHSLVKLLGIQAFACYSMRIKYGLNLLMDQLHLWILISSVMLLLKFQNICMTVAGIQCCPQFYFVVFVSIFLRRLSFLFSCVLVGCCYGRSQILLSGCLAELAVQ